jgi:tetratricopeptide (TPR) repeat protein
MMLAFPAAMLGAALAAENFSRVPRWLPVTAAIGALVLPAHQVMSNAVNPVFYLYHELAAFDSPAPAVMPELRELKAIHAMQEKNFAQAEFELTLAIKLASDPAGPAKQRGLLRASQRRWREARADFALVAQYDAENPEAWLMCAQTDLALGDTAAAAANLQHALSLAPSDWATRPDVAQLRARIGQK